MTANSSCELPRSDPRFALTPITLKWTPSICSVLSIGSCVPNRRSAVCQPMTATGLALSTSVALISRPRSASKLEKFTYSGDTPCTCMLSIDLSR